MADPDYTIKKIGADAGMLYVGGQPVGPSIGGFTHNPGAQWRTVEADGFTTEKAGMQRITGFDTHLTARMKDLSPEMLALMNPGSSSDGSSGNNKIVVPNARTFFTESQLIQDVRLIYRTYDVETGQNGFAAFIYPLMRPENAPQSGEDSNEQTREMDWKAILLESQSANEQPYFEVSPYDHASFDIDDYVTYAP